MSEIIRNEEGYYVQRRGTRCVIYNPKDEPLCQIPMYKADYSDEDMAKVLEILVPEDRK